MIKFFFLMSLMMTASAIATFPPTIAPKNLSPELREVRREAVAKHNAMSEEEQEQFGDDLIQEYQDNNCPELDRPEMTSLTPICQKIYNRLNAIMIAAEKTER